MGALAGHEVYAQITPNHYLSKASGEQNCAKQCADKSPSHCTGKHVLRAPDMDTQGGRAKSYPVQDWMLRSPRSRFQLA